MKALKLLLLVALQLPVQAAVAQGKPWVYATLDFNDDYGVSWTAPDFQATFFETLDDLIAAVEDEYGSLEPCPQRLGGPCITRTPFTHFLNLVGQDGWRLVATSQLQDGEWYIFERPGASSVDQASE